MQVFENLQGFIDQFLTALRGYLIAVRCGTVAFICNGFFGCKITAGSVFIHYKLNDKGLFERTACLDPVHVIHEQFKAVTGKGNVADTDNVNICCYIIKL